MENILYEGVYLQVYYILRCMYELFSVSTYESLLSFLFPFSIYFVRSSAANFTHPMIFTRITYT